MLRIEKFRLEEEQRVKAFVEAFRVEDNLELITCDYDYDYDCACQVTILQKKHYHELHSFAVNGR